MNYESTVLEMDSLLEQQEKLRAELYTNETRKFEEKILLELELAELNLIEDEEAQESN